ncbi:MAG: LytTR family DNA-binding domain-containing protein [Croceitalea sp.]|nr:LytTR family DNA-binding domain-containing protein [Croceitalea sp.]
MGRTLKIVIVEDEPISSAYLKNLLKQIGVEHKVLATLSSVADAIAFFSKNKAYDLLFMDIHLGDGTCFDLLNTINIDKPIVFCTTFDTYAIKAFRYNSIDYILKPVKKEDVQAAVNKYWSMNKPEEDAYLMRMDQMLDSFVSPRYKKRFLVRKSNQLKLIDINQVNCFFSEKGHSYLMEKSGTAHSIDFTLEKLEEVIDPHSFFRINRKMMVSIDEIYLVEDYFNNRLKIKLHNRVPLELVVSRNRVKDFKKWLKGVT